MLSRRDFLKYSTLLAGTIALPSFLPASLNSAQASPYAIPPANWISDYIFALDNPHLAPLNGVFNDILDNSGNVTLMIYDVLRGQLMAGIGTEAPMPVASSFKGPLFFFFMDVIDASVWGSVPVEYWGYNVEQAVPEEYRESWETHQRVLRNLYDMVVMSDNNAAGRIFKYIADYYDTSAPLTMFNDWSHDIVGVSQMSSMGQWRYGMPDGIQFEDGRYMNRQVVLNHELVQFNNVMTPRDLGFYYVWWQNEMNAQAQRVGEDLLSYIYDNRRSNIEKLADEFNGVAYSKNGSLSINETGIAPVVTDGGLLNLPDFGYYVITFLSGNANSRTPKIFERLSSIVSGVFDDQIVEISIVADADMQQREYFTAYLEYMYNDEVTVSPNHFNYAFVKYEGIPVYYQPNEDYFMRNPVISASRFGVHLVMQGALIRYRPLDDEWAELIPDSPTDNVQRRLAGRIFLKRSDLHPVSTSRSFLIPYFLKPDVDAQQKMVIVDVEKREMTLLEQGYAIFKTPIVLNDIDTPRGGHTLLTRWFSCSMQPWAPGVPFTTYFHEGGYAIHGSPWQRWETTVNKENVQQRTSAGCVNVPNWAVRIGDYIGPLDELIFRWMGGTLAPEQNVYEYGTAEHPTIWVYVVDQLWDLADLHQSPAMRELLISWETIINQIRAMSLTAPGSFFA